MGYRLSKCLCICVGLTFLVGCYLASLPIKSDQRQLLEASKSKLSTLVKKKRLAIIVPFRDRFEELLEFVPHITNFLRKQDIPYHIFVIQQIDNYRFNRASLINIGFLQTKTNYDYIAMHDVDLLPLNNNLKYHYPDKGPVHISSPKTHPKYHYDNFIGGILLVKNEHYELVNGMSNRYWGWGLEDDEFFVRLKDAHLVVTRPENITTGPDDTFKHNHDKSYRKRDMRKCYNQKEVTRKRDRQTGLHDVSYNLSGQHELTIDNLPLTVYNVALLCNRELTPWCLCPDPPKVKKSI